MEGIQDIPQQPKQETESIDQITPQEKDRESSLELSQETIEKILEKTKNINAYGTAFSVVSEYSAGWFKDETEERKKMYLDDMMDEDTFAQELMEGRGMGFIKGDYYHKPEIPLKPQYYSADQVYKMYADLINSHPWEGYLVQQMKSYGIDKMELPTDIPTPKDEFMEKYPIELERQQEEQKFKIKQTYQEYVQNLEDKVYGQSFERFKKKWLKEQFDYKSERNDLLDFNPKDPDYYVRILFSFYKRCQEDSDRETGSIKNLRYGHGERDKDKLKKMDLVEGSDEILLDVNEEEFKKKYLEIVEEQKEMLDKEAVEAYEKYLANFDENKYKQRKLQTIKSILKNGIFGGRSWFEGGEKGYVSNEPSEWAKDVRQKRRQRNVYFNVMGNFHNQTTNAPKSSGMGDSFFFRKRNNQEQPNNGIAVIFDAENISYTPDDPKLARGDYRYESSARGKGPDSQYGYKGPVRVASRKFEGIVISCTDQVKESDERYSKNVYSSDRNKWIQTAKDIAKVMVETNVNDPDKLIPVYDVFGNMLWPVEMSKEEIIKKTERKK